MKHLNYKPCPEIESTCTLYLDLYSLPSLTVHQRYARRPKASHHVNFANHHLRPLMTTQLSVALSRAIRTRLIKRQFAGSDTGKQAIPYAQLLGGNSNLHFRNRISTPCLPRFWRRSFHLLFSLFSSFLLPSFPYSAQTGVNMQSKTLIGT